MMTFNVALTLKIMETVEIPALFSIIFELASFAYQVL